jgi:hypothetical protein
MQGFIELWDSGKYREDMGAIRDFDALIYSVEDQLAQMERSSLK